MLDTKTNQYIALEYVSATDKNKRPSQQLEEYLHGNKSFALPFASISLSYQTPYSTLIPENVFKKEDSKSYASLNFSEADLLVLQHQPINNLGMVNLYGYTNEIKTLTKKYFPAAKELHHSTSLINAIIQMAQQNNGVSVAVNLHDESFDIIITDTKNLILFNTYQYKTKEDFLYFTLNAYSQLQLNTESIPLTLYGRVEPTSQIAETVRKYIKQVTFGKRIGQFKYSHKMQELPQHYFYNLFSQYLCV